MPETTLEPPAALLHYSRGACLGCFVSLVDKAHTNSMLPFPYCFHTAVSISRVAHDPTPQLLIGSRASERVVHRHRKHPSHPLACGIISAGTGSVAFEANLIEYGADGIFIDSRDRHI